MSLATRYINGILQDAIIFYVILILVWEVGTMKLLRVKASNFKNCIDNYTIDFATKSKKTAEDALLLSIYGTVTRLSESLK